MSDTPSPPPSSEPTTPAARPLVDLTELKLMPAWVANFGSTPERDYSKYEDRGERRGGDRRGGGGGAGGFAGRGGRGADRPQGERRFGGGGSGAGGGDRPRTFGDKPRGERPAGDRPRPPAGAERPAGDRPRSFGDRPQGDRPRREGGGDFRRGGERRFGGRDGGRDGDRREQRPPLPTGLKVTLEPSEAAAEALANHVRNQGRAFSVFDGAKLVLDDGERHRVRFECEAERLVGLYHVPSDGSLFETREDALRHLLRSAEAMAPFYKCEDVELEEPKGNFTSVAVCSISGEILGPPSHHSFQTALKRLHTERFSNMPLEVYKKRLENKADAELVTKWKEQQKKGQRWVYQKGEVAEGAEPQVFQTRAEMESHFRRTHAEEAVTEVREALVSGAAKQDQLSYGLSRLMSRQVAEARKHMFDLAQKLAQALERRGLKLFKRRAGKMYVSRIKPKAMDPSVALSDRIQAIVEKIKTNPGILGVKLIEELAPAATAAAPEAASTEGEVTPAPSAEARQLTEEQRSVIRDLHWLADEGYIIEYSDGAVFMGVQAEPPKEKPAKAQRQPQATGEATADEAPAAVTSEEASAEEPTTEEPTAEVEAPTPEPAAEAAEEGVVEAEATPSA